ncbi:RNA polymerase sigma-70 factor [Prevotella sp. DNF00663]|uniref:RNA polymerase sigma-70 factor n=1 Tax=unclassified Prevotella TaxID=2638335 RepID=UPI000512DBC4|nr:MULTISPECIES: RNA polymerase sigma-70 factor [unclassified Prevotella]KGI59642.1 RNA polymerase [Prevotella sp. S7 MS 2]KXB84992.1 RNA polymerase sigma-70 factor [Prevotella sp. DNF00663]
MNLSQRSKGKESYFKQLFDTYYAPFCLYAKRFIDDTEVRNDIVSDVFFHVWQKIDVDEFQTETAVEYIRLAVKSRCLNHLKHQNYEMDYAKWFQQRAPIYAESPNYVYTLDELYEKLTGILKQLPDEQRRIFTESFINEKTRTEIAKEMNVSVKTVQRYKNKVMEILRNQLKDYLLIALLFHLVREKIT